MKNDPSLLKKIPTISFKPKSDKKIKDFELLCLSEFFSRIPEIKRDHDPTRPHRLTFFVLLVVTKGTGTHQIDLKKYDLKEGSVLKIAKGQVHAFQENANYEGYLIVFTENYILKYFSKSSINLIPNLYNYHINVPLINNKPLSDFFINQLNLELRNEDTNTRKNIIAVLLNLFLLRLEPKLIKRNSKPTNYTTFLKFKNLVESNYKLTRNVKDYAEELNISTKQLNKATKDFTLNTAKYFIDQYVILEIKRSIVSTEKSLKEIAFDTGFNEVTNFTKFFKNKTTISPKDFRSRQLT